VRRNDVPSPPEILHATGRARRRKFAERGLNVIVPAGVVDLAYLSDPPSAGVRILETAGVEVQRGLTAAQRRRGLRPRRAYGARQRGDHGDDDEGAQHDVGDENEDHV
jgi:hypothetical protein